MAQEENLIEIEEVKNQLEEAKDKCEEYLNGWKRERADFLNYKKDEMERIGQLVKYSNEELILKIIPILDNIYLAESHVPDDLKDNDWIKGFNAIKNQLCDFLKKEGIEPISTDGKFDPNLMEAVEEVERSEGCPVSGAIVEEVQRGYTMGGTLIRVAKVKVAK
ncbi:MAG: nucleotide exchange factor GrpE [Candidatus Staskawiczbacteria bacterium]|jgi:molecular chaperone GrpE